MYTIKRAAELTGISVATLRAWERRYGVVSPKRSDGGYRLYGAEDVRALAIMNSLVNEGWSAREAATETLRRLSSRDAAGKDGRDPRERTHAVPRRVAPLRPGSRYQSEDAEAFIRAAERLDSASATAVLDARFGLGTFEHVVDDWLMPTLELVGEEWAHGRLTVAGEHLVSYAVQRRLAAAYEAASGRADGPTLLIGLPPGARHELGLLAFAVAARRAGFATVYVGADLPAEEWVRAIEARRAAGMVMAVPRHVDIAAARKIVETVNRSHPEVVIGLGGSQQDEIGGSCVHLGHSITVAVGEMSRRLRVPA
ncbi:MAG: MerR family transcriptional regulator [Dermatophilaceae bacterium]|nr:MerR family transcriptional regulator [Dermatophilaceae bacterium]NUO90398.1 MerR family transcriptional regulator [Dermatophilaceae bacterium]NUR17847.1 MerR family transcriptional regulator [Dermatophilaceae bacterium]